MERKNTGQLSLACPGNLRDNRQPRRLGSVLPSSNAITPAGHLVACDSFFVADRHHFEVTKDGCMYILLTKREVKMAGYWPSSLFAFLWTETKSRSIKT